MTSDSDPVIELGRSLANALDPSDIIGRWMAHHLADLITRSEAQPADQQLAGETREVILKLWESKAGGRFKRRPFDYVQPVLSALARLEPDPPPWVYFRTLSAEELPPVDDLVHYPLLKAACDMDREFGQLMRLAVALAAQGALDREEPWVIAATAFGGTEVDNVVQQLQRRIRTYRVEAALYQDPDPADEPFESDSNEQAGGADQSRVESDGYSNLDDEVLTMALKAAITRCTNLLGNLDQLVAGSDFAVVPTTPEAARESSKGSQ